PLSVPADGVLANDNDIDGDPLTAELAEPPLHGSVTLEEDGSFVYTPNLGLDGTDTFTYRVHDGETASDLVVVTLDVTFQPPATAPEGTIGLAASPDVVSPGDSTTVSGSGFNPGETVRLVLYSSPVILAQGVADSSGS